MRARSSASGGGGLGEAAETMWPRISGCQLFTSIGSASRAFCVRDGVFDNSPFAIAMYPGNNDKICSYRFLLLSLSVSFAVVHSRLHAKTQRNAIVQFNYYTKIEVFFHKNIFLNCVFVSFQQQQRKSSGVCWRKIGF